MNTKTQKKEVQNLEVSEVKTTPAKVLKIGMSLDRTIEVVNTLFTRTRHRAKMLYYTETLKTFEVEQKAENLDDERYAYRGCVLNIKDDHGKEFSLKNPVLILEVVKFLEKRFHDKISEMEAEIVLP